MRLDQLCFGKRPILHSPRPYIERQPRLIPDGETREYSRMRRYRQTGNIGRPLRLLLPLLHSPLDADASSVGCLVVW